jgi:AcrR family transcriptional regulator
MPETSATRTERPLRADARNNRSRILEAARDVFVEQGPSAPLEEISRRAGTGIATLYRRFPDRQALMRAVVLDALQRSAAEVHQALAEEPSPFAALTRYMHSVMDVRTAAVIPALLGEVSLEDEEIRPAREEGARLLQVLVDAAHRGGTLRQDVTAADIGTLVVRLSRPLPGTFARDINDQLGHRHLDLLINGLRAVPDRAADIAGPPLTLDDLRDLTPGSGAQ